MISQPLLSVKRTEYTPDFKLVLEIPAFGSSAHSKVMGACPPSTVNFIDPSFAPKHVIGVTSAVKLNCGADLMEINSKSSENLQKPSETTIEVKAEEIK